MCEERTPNLSVLSTAPSPLSTSACARKYPDAAAPYRLRAECRRRRFGSARQPHACKPAANSVGREGRPWFTEPYDIDFPLVGPGRPLFSLSSRVVGQPERPGQKGARIAMCYTSHAPGFAQTARPAARRRITSGVAPAVQPNGDCQIGRPSVSYRGSSGSNKPPTARQRRATQSGSVRMRGNPPDRARSAAAGPKRNGDCRESARSKISPHRAGLPRIGKRGHKDEQSGLLGSKVAGHKRFKSSAVNREVSIPESARSRRG